MKVIRMCCNVLLGTGTGKTLSFVLPILEHMSAGGQIRSERGRPPCTLVMAPTRELANQVSECLNVYSKDSVVLVVNLLLTRCVSSSNC